MPSYRFYLLNEHDRIVRGTDAVCDDDGQACEKAAAMDHPHAIEVWQGARLVDRVNRPTPTCS